MEQIILVLHHPRLPSAATITATGGLAGYIVSSITSSFAGSIIDDFESCLGKVFVGSCVINFVGSFMGDFRLDFAKFK
jgi:hypothetical protein